MKHRKHKKRTVRDILIAILLVEVVLLILMLWAIRVKRADETAKEIPVFSTSAPHESEREEIPAKQTQNIQIQETNASIYIEELEVEIVEAESAKEILDVESNDFPLFTISCEEKLSYNHKEKESWIIPLTLKEFKEFCMLISAEGAAECIEGQISIGATFINRMLEPGFPDTFRGVLYAPYQFSCVKNGRIYSSVEKFEDLPQKTINAAIRALRGEDPTEEILIAEAERLGVDIEKYATGGALYFYNPDKCGDRNCVVQIKIGNHTFTKVWKR